MINELLNQLANGSMDYFTRIEKLNLLRYLAQAEKDEKLIKVACSTLINVINQHMKDLNKNEQMATLDILKTTHTIYGRYNFESFLIAMEWDRPIEKRFYQPRMKVLKPVVDDLQDLGDGKLDLYSLSLPPRIGKTTIGLFFITWIAGRFPDEHIFGVGYVSGLVGTFYNGVVDFISSEEYRFYDIFPELNGRLNKSAENRTIDLWEDERYKTVTFRSVDGQITGALEASSLLYMDDMCSGIEEATKIDRLDKLWEKVSVDVMQRRVKNKRSGRASPILMIGTIWSLHDPISRLQRRNADNPRARFRRMPALNDDGESNFNYDYDVGFTTEMYQELKEGMDEVSWECVYQQNPMERDGLLFPSGDLKRYLQLPGQAPDSIVAVCDVAFGGTDYLSMPIAYVYGDQCYIEDVVFRSRADYHVTEPMVAGKILTHGVQMMEFEANNGGDFYARDVDDMVRKQSNHRCNITTKRASTKQSKLTRIIQFSPDIKEFYFKDSSMYSPKDEYGMFMTNLTTFVQTGEVEHEDGPDSLAMLASYIKIPRFAKITSKTGMRGII